MNNNIVPSSFNRPVETTKHILKKHPVKPQSSLWFGKKVYLGYSKEKGWKVYELNIFERIFRKLNLAYQDTHLNHVMKKLKKLSQAERVFLKNALPHLGVLSGMFKEVPGDSFRKMSNGATDLPSREQKSEPSKTPQSQTDIPKPTESVSPEPVVTSSEEVILPETKREETLSISSPVPSENEKANEVGKIGEEVILAETKREETLSISSPVLSENEKANEVGRIGEEVSRSESPPATSPLYLKNYNASRLRLDSVLEMMLSQDEIRTKNFRRIYYVKISMIRRKSVSSFS